MPTGHCPIGKTGVPVSQGTVDFNKPTYTSSKDGDYNKCKWAKKCSVSWDGIDDKCA